MPGSADDVIARVMDAALAGDPEPAARAFAERPWLRRDLFKRLVATPSDAAIAAVFARMWRDVGGGMPADLLPLLRWYLQAEAPGTRPARADVHREVLARLLAVPDLPVTDAGFELAFAAVRAVQERPAPLSLYALANAALERVARVWNQDPGRRPGSVMLYAALGLLRTDLLRPWLDRLPDDHPPAVEVLRARDWVLDQMVEYQGEADPWLTDRILADHAADPGAAGAARRRAWLAFRRDEGIDTAARVLQAIRVVPEDPQTQVALKYALWNAQLHEMNDLAAWAADHLQALDPDWRPSAPARPPEPEGQTRPAERSSDLEGLLQEGLALAGCDLARDAPPAPDALRQAFRELAVAARTGAVPAGWALGQFADAAHVLRGMTITQFAWATHFLDTPHTTGRPEYGLADLRKMPALDQGLLGLAMAFCQAGLAWIETGNETRGLWALVRILQIHTDCASKLGRFAEGAEVLDRIRATGLLPETLSIETDNLRLAEGSADDRRHLAPDLRQGTAIHPILSRPDWLAAEARASQVLARDPVIQGHFLVTWPDGRRKSYPHATQSREIVLAQVPGAGVIADGLVVGPGGRVLRPDPYHTSRDYPKPSRTVVAGQGGQLRLRPAGQDRIDRPVLLLDAFAALFWPNYYHWMIPHLSRVAFALEQGLLDGRALVLPEGLRSWMLETLDLVGLRPDQRLFVPTDRLVRFDDATLLSSIEHLSPATLGALRRRVLGPAAAAEAPPSDGPFYFLSRRNRSLRKMTNEDEVEAIARDLGFDLIQPETHSVAEQVRLFSGARGIAGPEGAALANSVFAAPGTRVLAMVCENDMLPVFNDLSLTLGHRHMKLAGPGDVALGGTRFQPAFGVDAAAARAALRWVIEGT